MADLLGPTTKKKKIRHILPIILFRTALLILTGQPLTLGSSTWPVFEQRLAEAMKCMDGANVDADQWTDEEINVGDIIEELASEVVVCSASALASYSTSLEAALVSWRAQ